ncbi:MAG: sulfotransferase domain-containing protein [Gammaproteobacteria bacterium]|jgi:aryl sulfotransferase|nr:sulfotransferase domain-containing protein [Gammaproteobacteria bacterium]
MSRTNPLPRRSQLYLSPYLCSDNWDLFNPRDDDIVVASAFKAGTTWMQTIVANLIFPDGEFPEPVMHMSPWIDRYRSDNQIVKVMANIEQQTHRRFLKTHLPLDALRYLPQLRYIFLSRDVRDAFMSLWNHHRNYSQEQLDRLDQAGIELGIAWPDIPSDINEFWRQWLTRAWFPWEAEGYPYWSMFHNVRSWWPYRLLPNILFVHYNDLLADTPRQIQRVAEFLDIGVTPELVQEIAERVSLEAMRENADKVMGDFEKGFIGGAAAFLNKGTNGRWHGVLSGSDLGLYEAALERNFDTATARWSEHGGEIGPY